jgi:gas vesicle protein
MSNKTTKILIAAAAGLAAGVALGLLFAPEKGSETRKKVRKVMDDLTSDLGGTIEEKLASIREKLGMDRHGAPKEPGEGTSGEQTI